MATIYLIFTPIFTGLAVLFFLKIGTVHPILGQLHLMLSAILAMMIIYIFDRPTDFSAMGVNTLKYGLFFVIINASCTISWLYALKGYSSTITAFVEISYPIFLAIFSILIFKDAGMNKIQLLGAVITMVGVSVVIGAK